MRGRSRFPESSFAGESDVWEIAKKIDPLHQPTSRVPAGERPDYQLAAAYIRGQVPSRHEDPGKHAVKSLKDSARMSHPRDGRRLRCEAKPKAYLSVERFLSRGGGFFGAGQDATLADLGLCSMMPSHYTRHPGKNVGKQTSMCRLQCRKTADFVYRYMKKCNDVLMKAESHDRNIVMNLVLRQELASQKHKSVCLLCDASPKARMDAPRLKTCQVSNR